MKHILILTLLFSLLISQTKPKELYKIAIDIGHTPNKHGATSARGIGEYRYNRNIALKLLAKLQQKGFYKAFVINHEGKEIKLKHRTKVAKLRNADLFISIHHDSLNKKYLKRWTYDGKKRHFSNKFKGYSIFISRKNPENLKLATILGNNLVQEGLTPTLHHSEKIKGEHRKLLDKQKGIYDFGQLVVLRTSSIPSLLFECGIILNKKEELLLRDTKYQDKLVSILANSLEEYYFNN